MSTYQGCQCGAYVGAVEEMMYTCCVCECYKRDIVVMDVIWRLLCVSMILRKSDLFVLSWARVRRGSISSELLMCGGCVCSISLLPLVARCLETIGVCICHMFVFMSVVMTVWRSVGMFYCVAAVVKDSVF